MSDNVISYSETFIFGQASFEPSHDYMAQHIASGSGARPTLAQVEQDCMPLCLGYLRCPTAINGWGMDPWRKSRGMRRVRVEAEKNSSIATVSTG
jgi:hypothetical protein